MTEISLGFIEIRVINLSLKFWFWLLLSPSFLLFLWLQGSTGIVSKRRSTWGRMRQPSARGAQCGGGQQQRALQQPEHELRTRRRPAAGQRCWLRPSSWGIMQANAELPPLPSAPCHHCPRGEVAGVACGGGAAAERGGGGSLRC